MENKGTSLGIDGVVLIVFIILKLCHVIDWSWLWVLSPLWISIGIVLVLYFIVAIIRA